MADEPNKKMDEILRAYAEERRKAPELYLHPATRRMLHGEVSRTIGKPEGRRSWRDRLRAFWPQIAFGGALCFVLGIAVLSLRQGPPKNIVEGRDASRSAAGVPEEPPQIQAKDEMRMESQGQGENRLNEQFAPSVEKKEQAAPPQTVPALKPAQESLVHLDAKTETLRRALPAAPKRTDAPVQTATTVSDLSLGATVAPKAEALGEEPQRDPLNREVTELYSVVPSPQPVVVGDEVKLRVESGSDLAAGVEIESLAKQAAGSTRAFRNLPEATPQPAAPQRQTLGSASELTNLGAARRFYFVRTTNPPPGAVAPMFSSFQVEQTGKNLKVLDRDGSVYLGTIVAQTNVARPAATPQAGQAIQSGLAVTRQRVQEAVPTPANALEFNISVRGTNRTLGQDVVLTGQMFERTNAGQMPVDRLSVAPSPTALGRRVAEPEPRMMIIGNAVVGSTNQVPVRAFSRGP